MAKRILKRYALLLVAMAGVGGCRVEEAVVDGFYTAITETVARWLTDLVADPLLGVE